MSQGVKFVLSNGRTYDSSSVPVSFVDVITIAGGSSGSRAYPELAGFTLDCSTLKQSSSTSENLSDHSVAYSAGYPVVSWAPSRTGRAGSTQNLLVLAR